MIKQSAFLAAALATALSASAVPARPGFRTITQPDGTEITAALVGDETCHFYRTADGTPLLMDSDGYLRLATVDAKGRPAQGDRYLTSTIRTEAENEAALNALSRRASEKRETYAQSGLGLFGTYPSTGEVRCLVFLVEYTDVKFTVSDPNSFFTDMLNQEGFNQYGATGSARDYFLDQSSGAFRPTFDVYGP
ncbi:MAG: hypothetical protein K2F79_02400, partial [Muribaculaceae bacterium]|nr:hypothetical protein [Muribaculaceae bacterium]